MEKIAYGSQVVGMISEENEEKWRFIVEFFKSTNWESCLSLKRFVT